MRDFNDNYKFDNDEFEQEERFRRKLCGEAPLKVENGSLICSDCSREFIDKFNLVRLQNFDGEKIMRKLEHYRIPYKDHYHRRARFCDLYCKILPNSNLEHNLNLLLEYFGNKTFIYLFSNLTHLEDIFDENTASIYLSVLLKSINKGFDIFNPSTILALNKIFESLLNIIKFKFIFQKRLSDQEDFVVKSILCFFLSVRNIDPKFIDSIIKTHFITKVMDIKDFLIKYIDGEIDLYSHNLQYTNQEIKLFIRWLHKRIRILAQGPETNIKRTFKILLLGPSKGGKSAICNYILNKSFIEPTVKPNKDINFYINIAKFSFHNIEFSPCLLEFNTDTIIYPDSQILDNISGILLVFDITDIDQFAQLESWLIELEKKLNVPLIIAANKKDLCKHINISKEKVNKLKEDYNIFDYVECSAKTGENIDKLFQKLCLKIVKEWII